MSAFHEVRFPTDISLGATGGPTRMTEVVTMRSGFEERNSVWANSRRKWNAGYGVKSFYQLRALVAFFEERRGRFAGFRWKDALDFRSRADDGQLTAFDQALGVGDGATMQFQLVKTYGSLFSPWARTIRKPVVGTALVGKNGVLQTSGYTLDTTTGLVTFAVAPTAGQPITAGFEFDTPVRFDTDSLDVSYAHFGAGQIPSIPVIELLS